MGEYIKASSAELRQLGDQLEKFTNGEYAEFVKKVNNTINAALGNWEGNARNKYEARFEEIKPILYKTIPELLLEMSEEAKQRADAYKIADS